VTDWIAKSTVLAIHDAQLAEHGGLPGIRDDNILESALTRPKQLEAYATPPPDIAALAAAYAFGIAKNHAFADANKRTSYVVTQTFLALNGHELNASDVACIEAWVQLGEGAMSETAFADWLRSNIAKLE
jgi:death on curing protein